MNQLTDFADPRLVHGCVYCRADIAGTRDHVPSRVLLDAPFPDNLPVVDACPECNNGFSRDEAYLACLVECVLSGTTDPEHVGREAVGAILRRSPALRSQLERARREVGGATVFVPETARVENVMRKLAAGHSVYELSLVPLCRPSRLLCRPLALMSEQERSDFETPPDVEMFGEVGSRGMQRTAVVQVVLQDPTGHQHAAHFLLHDWVVVQQNRYRYLAAQSGSGVMVRIVLSEYLGCEAWWGDL